MNTNASEYTKSKIKEKNGQVFIEFILLLLLLVTISFAFMGGFRFLIGTRWEIMLKIIARPNQDSVVLP